ncbi:FkbM family methyltransferase [Geitlerinema splendidum]|nr:FkbM family methyltransferase [Geitlerinema splendidum]
MVQKFNYAISSSNAPITIYISDNPEANTIKEVAHQSWCNDGAIEVEGITFETFIKRYNIPSIDVLKIDIEGAELELFKGMSDEALKGVKQIAVEFHDFIEAFDCTQEVKEIKERLISLGFLCIIPLRKLNVDVLFINKNKCSLSQMDSLFLSVKYDFIPYGIRFIRRNISRVLNLPKKVSTFLQVVTRS